MTATALRPGVQITSRSDAPPRGISTDTGTWFVVGTAQKGPTGKAQLIHSMTEFAYYFGSRQSYSILWDALETFFKEGGQQAYVVRVSGTSSAAATKTLLDGSAGNSLVVTAKNVGVWGNSLSVAVTQPVANTFQLAITHTTLGLVDLSPYLTTQADAVNWSRNSDWVNVAIGASSLIPAVAAASALTGGADDISGVSDTQRQTALSYFTADLGPGQVSIPGNVTTANRTALIAHARAYGREAILDDTDTSSRSAIVTEAVSLQGDEFGALFAPWCVIPPYLPQQSPRVVPPCALVAGLMARSDATNSPNVPAAGDNGRARFVLDVTQPAWSDSDRDALNTAGCNIIRNFNGAVELYGIRTLANPNGDTSWLDLANQRFRNLLYADLNDVAQSFVFDQIDGRGLKTAEFAGALTAVLNRYLTAGALYGDSPDSAFRVDVGPGINTQTTLANNELHAVVSVRISPSAELVVIEVAKVSVAQSL